MLKDKYGRVIDYIRISLTDRCNLRCRYCLPEEGIKKFKHTAILTFEEIERLIKIFQELGIKKFRFTGGEPFVRKGTIDFFEKLQLKNFYVTTNLAIQGLNIERINELQNLSGINISCDSLKPEKYEYITRRGKLETFIENIRKLRIKNLKINVVVIKNFNEDEIINFINLGIKYNATVRFIEKMNFIDDKLYFVSLTEIKNSLIKNGIIFPDNKRENNSVARYYPLKNKKGKVGFITPISNPFCATCNKIRVKANGDIKLCIFDRKNFSLRDLMRRENDDEKIKNRLQKIIKNKHEKPPIKKGNETIAKIGG
jgi:cyclic pyranopterin phosphate synthase